MISNFISSCIRLAAKLALCMLLIGRQAEATCCSGTFDIFADLLVWKASEETSAVWSTVLTEPVENSLVFDVKDLTFNWDLGFRVGAGYHFACNEWDTQFYWTRFRTKASDSIPTTDGLVLTEFFAGFVVNNDTGLSGKIKWNIHYDMFDWELGYNCCLTENLFLRPFIGVKGGWIDQSIDSSWDNSRLLPNFTTIFYSSTEDLKNDFWGVGPSVGVNSKWNLGCCCTSFFSLFGDVSTAVMWGNWRCKDVYTNSIPEDTCINLKDSPLGAWMIRGFFGIGWESDFCNESFRFSTQLGYEMQLWLNQLRIPTFQLLRLHGDLTLQGGTLRFRFDF